MKRSLLNFVIGLSTSMLVVFISLTYSYGSTNIMSAEYRQFSLTQDSSSTKKNEDVKDKVRILCWILTTPFYLRRKAIHVQNTWIRRCNVRVFMSLQTDEKFPAVNLNVSGNADVTTKTVKGFQYVYDKYIDDADWFMKIDDDSYVIMENLGYFLSNENKDSPVYSGCHFKRNVKQGRLSESAIYILSKDALKRFARSDKSSNLCEQDLAFETCIEALGMKALNSTDSLGRSRFHHFDPKTSLYENKKVSGLSELTDSLPRPLNSYTKFDFDVLNCVNPFLYRPGI